MKKLNVLAMTAALASAMVGTAFAADALVSGSVSGASANPGADAYVVDTTSLTEEERSSIATAEFTFTIDSNYMNGGGGYNTNGTDWTQPDGFEFTEAGTHTYVMPVSDYALGDDGSDSLQVQEWWLNVNEDGTDGSFTLDSVELKDADGNVILAIGAAAETGDVAPVAYIAAVVALAGVALVASRKARA